MSMSFACSVGVDAVGFGLRVGDDLPALVAVGLDQQSICCGDERLGRRAGHERLPARHEREGVDAGHVGDRGARRPAAELQQQHAVAGGHPAGAEGDVVAGLAVDVRRRRTRRRAAAGRAGRSRSPASAPIGWKSSGRKWRSMSASVTLPRSGVRPSYSGSWSRDSSVVGRPAVVAGRQDVARHVAARTIAPPAGTPTRRSWRGPSDPRLHP